MRRLRLFVATLILLLMPATSILAATNPFADVCKAEGADTSAACQTTGADPLTGPAGAITRSTRLIAFLAGVAAVILIIVGGIMYALANGDPGKVTNAKNTVIYALVGLVVVITAQGIILFVVNRL